MILLGLLGKMDGTDEIGLIDVVRLSASVSSRHVFQNSFVYLSSTLVSALFIKRLQLVSLSVCPLSFSFIKSIIQWPILSFITLKEADKIVDVEIPN